MSSDPLVGQMIGRYRVERVLGRGGMGRVYLGVQPEIGSRVAIKVLSEDCTDLPEYVERFFAEARTVNLIDHDNIIRVVDLDRLPTGRPFIVMEYVSGTSLRAVIDAGRAPLGGVVHVMIEVLLALAAAHAAGVVHRDLKPDNVMLAESGRAKVLDFGIAKLLASGPRTRTGAALGTPEYMAPEQILGRSIDARVDVYGAGVMLFELCTGRRPFEGATDYQLMEGHLHEPAPSARALRPDIPVALDDVIRQALAKKPEERFASATAMANALRVASAALPVDAWQPLVATPLEVSQDNLPIVEEPETVVSSPKGRLDRETVAVSPPPVIVVAPPPAVKRRWWLPVGAIAIAGAGVAAIAMRHDAPTVVAIPDAARVVAQAPPIDAMVVDAAALPVDATVPADARRAPAGGLSAANGWRPDPKYGFSPPVHAEDPKLFPGVLVQQYTHDLTGTDPAHFDPATWAPTALKIARELDPRARFAGFSIDADRDGAIDWAGGFSVRMWFTAPSATDQLACIHIYPRRDGVDVERSSRCTHQPVALPHCKRAQIYPAKTTIRPETVWTHFQLDGDGWTVEQSRNRRSVAADRVVLETFPDDCE